VLVVDERAVAAESEPLGHRPQRQTPLNPIAAQGRAQPARRILLVRCTHGGPLPLQRQASMLPRVTNRVHTAAVPSCGAATAREGARAPMGRAGPGVRRPGRLPGNPAALAVRRL